MLNKENIRELAYVVTIDSITSIEGYDRVELAHIGGWTVVVGKHEFEAGDSAIYFEIDSKLPEVKPFTDMEFLAKKKYKVKTQKMCKSISQGLLISAEQLGWTTQIELLNGIKTCAIVDDKNKPHYPNDESRFLTQKLGVIYAIDSDNKRKAKSVDKYKVMTQRHGKLFSRQPFRFMMKHTWGKKILFVFFGKKKDKKTSWPVWVKKTDEERCQNMPWILEDKEPWIVTEKIDGSSTTFTVRRHGKLKTKFDFFVCSRNVVFDKPDKPCFYDSNIYLEMAEKYDIENKMKAMFFDNEFKGCEWITIQGETYGSKIQNRDYSIKGHDFKAFNLIDSTHGRWNTIDMKDFLEKYYDIPCVPIVEKKYILPDTIEELLDYATGTSVCDGLPREGIVLRDYKGEKSFKAVSNEYLLKYHNG